MSRTTDSSWSLFSMTDKLGYFRTQQYFGTVSSLSMGKWIWFSGLKHIAYRYPKYIPNMTLAVKKLGNSHHTSVVGGLKNEVYRFLLRMRNCYSKYKSTASTWPQRQNFPMLFACFWFLTVFESCSMDGEKFLKKYFDLELGNFNSSHRYSSRISYTKWQKSTWPVTGLRGSSVWN